MQILYLRYFIYESWIKAPRTRAIPYIDKKILDIISNRNYSLNMAMFTSVIIPLLEKKP